MRSSSLLANWEFGSQSNDRLINGRIQLLLSEGQHRTCMEATMASETSVVSQNPTTISSLAIRPTES